MRKKSAVKYLALGNIKYYKYCGREKTYKNLIGNILLNSSTKRSGEK